MKSVCVFCGANRGADTRFAESAAELGQALAKTGRTLVYGGGNIGLMGLLADAALTAGGHVIGVIPESLVAREVAHLGLPDLRVVTSMHERKALMASLADAFIALPGGIGTLEELFEVWTWGQLGLHAKPCGLLNVGDFYTPLLAFLDHATQQRFLRQEQRDMVLVASRVSELIERLEHHQPVAQEKWIDRNGS